ncbi:hypothetical protein APH_1047 [Anaplasma phagocytophilum str. HZ]|uniref:Uncharacterized protein n=1 Tax=Anaplasma phagocytophilum (strain HZ) TaxID=212042 RepID=Q2GJ47_ANAPZ|nr:hypothetical protein APH_1047 [Anaplasma phagocytophilum str. HZ]
MVYACYFVVLSEAYVALVAASIAAQGWVWCISIFV